MCKVYEDSENECIDGLLEWVTLVCSLCDEPISNFTTSFVSNQPFNCIFKFYFPSKGGISLERQKEILPTIFGKT